MAGNTPQISTSTYATTAYNLQNTTSGGFGMAQSLGSINNMLSQDPSPLMRRAAIAALQNLPTKPKDEPMTVRRMVQVFIADPDENVPLEKSVLYRGDQKLTDSNDQELYFEIDMKKLLDDHNTFRITIPNKKVKERVEMLEPVKIRDLKMVVVEIAKF